MSPRLSLKFLSAQRPLDYQDRYNRFKEALKLVHSHNPDHLIITGDLTEDGAFSQFEVLAEILHDSLIDPSQVTLIAGNHDAYEAPGIWEKALSGPLQAFQEFSQNAVPIHFDDAVILPISTSVHQSITRSYGRSCTTSIEKIRETLHLNPTIPVIVCQHHQPYPWKYRIAQWVDGFINHSHMIEMIRDNLNLHVLHGHIHKALDWSYQIGRLPQVFSSSAVTHQDNCVRIYETSGNTLIPII